VPTSPGDRRNIHLRIARAAGRIREILVEQRHDSDQASTILRLDEDRAQSLMDLAAQLHNPAPDGVQHVALDAALASEAGHLLGAAERRRAAEQFRRLLTDPAEFERARRGRSGREAVWQAFLDRNPWILGIGLAGQLLTSWNPGALQQIVAGFSVAGRGKRTDALLRTSGRIRSLVFAEIKHHETQLLSRREYRPACWAPSQELVGAVTQVQQTVHIATREIGRTLAGRAADGSETGDLTYLVRPRSFVIAGNLDQLRGEAGVHPGKQQSFELYRRNLYEPEIVTFDELLARAEAHAAGGPPS
jgi:hypothetical protein